jgi:hypothetical protein
MVNDKQKRKSRRLAEKRKKINARSISDDSDEKIDKKIDKKLKFLLKRANELKKENDDLKRQIMQAKITITETTETIETTEIMVSPWYFVRPPPFWE